MPPLGLHTVVAKEIGDRLRHRVLDEERGALYLGSTAPDIRVLTRWERHRTHFFDLSNFDEQSGVAGLFQAHPHLADVSLLDVRTVSFVAGYITHLVMDEVWINQVYRPFFGERSPLRGSLRANIMDKAVQFALDQERRNDRWLMEHVLREITRGDLGIDIGFIDGETMRRWREVIVEVLSRPPDWERFRFVASRYLREAGLDSPEAFGEFLKTLPELVEETVRYLTPERIQEFMAASVEKGLEAVRGYLCS